MNKEKSGSIQDSAVSKIEFEAALMVQEHRLFFLLHNFFVRRTEFEKDDPRRDAVTRAFIWRIVIALLPGAALSGVGITAILGVAIAWRANSLLSNQNVLLGEQTTKIELQNKLFDAQNELVNTQNSLAEASRRAALSFELTSILDHVSRDNTTKPQEEPLLQGSTDTITNKTTKLSTAIESRLVALTRSLRPYRFLDDNGKLQEEPLSPERGQILVALVSSNIDLSNIAPKLVFRNSDLRNANLDGADMRELDFTGSDFSGSSLVLSDFRGANLTNVQFNKCNLSGADFLSYGNGLRTRDVYKLTDRRFNYFTNLSHASFEDSLLYRACFSADSLGINADNNSFPDFSNALLDECFLDCSCVDIDYAKSLIAKISENVPVNTKVVEFLGPYQVIRDHLEFSETTEAAGNVVNINKACESVAVISTIAEPNEKHLPVSLKISAVELVTRNLSDQQIAMHGNLVPADLSTTVAFFLPPQGNLKTNPPSWIRQSGLGPRFIDIESEEIEKPVVAPPVPKSNE